MIVVDVGKKKMKELRMRTTGAVDTGLKMHMDEYETHAVDPYDPMNALVFSAGPFAHPDVQGGNRGVVSFRSPLTGGFFVSSAGNLGHYITLTGDSAITLVGRSDVPVVVAVIGDEAGTSMQIFELSDFDDVANDVFEFDRFLHDELKDVFSGAPFRAVIAGAAARHTDYGALVSIDPVMKTPDFFGRGGAGSVMVQAHNVYALVIGGSVEPDFEKAGEFIEFVEKKLGIPYAKAVADATVKYRFKEEDGLGGTILNWAHLKTTLPAYNWQMIYLDESERERLWEEKISPAVEKLRKLFADRTMLSKTCGEKCAAVCKKVWEGKKLDYEPITSLGAQLGIFDPEKIREITHLADRLGFDAIQAGNVVAWLLELRDRGIVNLEGVPETSMKPFAVDGDRQADAVKKILLAIAFGDLPQLGKGIRRASEVIKPEARHYAVYVPFSSGGEIVPPQYWVPGFFVPLPLHGKFMTYYGADWRDPAELGGIAWEHFHKELMIENAGFCRFHRGWVNKVLSEAYKKFYGVDIDLEIEGLAARISRYQRSANAVAETPESQRTIDLLRAFAELHGEKVWAERLSDKAGAEAYFEAVKKGISIKKATVLKR